MLSAGLLLLLFFADGLFEMFAAGLGERILVPVRLLTALWVSAWFRLLLSSVAPRRAYYDRLAGRRLVVHMMWVVLW